MKKVVSLIIVAIIAVLMSACSLTVDVSCDAKVEATTETMVAIKVQSASENARLIDAMRKLKAAEELDYAMSGTFMTEINGKAGAADYSSFWALYTSDEEFSNTDWGTYEYDGKVLASATFGAKDLSIKAGEYYVWVFTSY